MGAQNERAVIDLVINGKQSETSLKAITTATVNARKALVNMAQTDPGYKKQEKELRSLMEAQSQRIVRINQEKSAWEKFKSVGSGVMAGVIGGNLASAGIQTLLSLPAKLKDAYQGFNSASADMSANLGLAAKDVEYFNAQAIKMGPAFGKSAAEMLEGFKLVGSANSDLIKTPELLAAVTQQAMTLSQASRMSLEGATASLVGSMNQFDAGADQSTRFINVMAGGAQVGSAEIGDMAMSLKASGIVAHQAGLSFEETNGALQSLSKESLKGEQAGTMLRNILLSLQTGADDTNPKVVGLDKALDNLAKKNLSTAEMTKLFGKENITAAMSLINHRDRVAEFTKGLTNTSAAYDMAAKNNATLSHQSDVFWAKVEGLAVSLGTRLAPAFSKVYAGGTDLITLLPKIGSWLVKNSEWIVITAVPALLTYNVTLIKATAAALANTVAEGYRRVAYQAGFAWLVITETATKTYALATGVLTGQISLQTAVVTIARNVWAVFSAVLLANPIGLVVGAMAGLIAAMKYFAEHTKAALDVEKKKQALQQAGLKWHNLASKAQQAINEKLAHYNDLSKIEQDDLKKTIVLKQQEARVRLQAALARAREIARAEGTQLNGWERAKVKVANAFSSTDELKADLARKAEEKKATAYAEAKQLANIDQLQADLDGFGRQMAQTKPPEKTNNRTPGGGLTEEQKKAAEKATKKNKADALHDAEELEKMLGDSRKRIMGGEESDYDKEVAAFADKYARMYELAKDNQEKIDEIRRLSMLEFADIDKRRLEKQDEDDRRQAQKDSKDAFDAAMKKADQDRTDTMGGIDRSQAFSPTAIGDAEVQRMKLEADQVYLNQKLLMEQVFAQESAETQRQLTENWNAQVILRANTEHGYAEQMKQSEWALQDAKRNAMAQGIGVLQGFLKQGTIAYRAAIIGQKAFAIAQVIVDMNREIAQIYANPTWSLMPDGGLTLKTANATAAKIRAGVSIASIAAQGIGELTQKDDGGFTGIQDLYGSPSGFVGKPTRVNAGARSYIVGEKRKEWIMGGDMLKNPVMANLAGALQALQVTGGYKNLSLGNSPAGSPTGSNGGNGSASNDALLMTLIRETQQTRAAMEASANRDVVLNYRLFENYADQVQQIRQENKL